VGKPFAIVLDDLIMSAPRINEPILGGSGQISGNFTVEETNSLAVVLRSGALPAKLTIVEERTVGPSLGSDSIEAGFNASIIGLVLVVIFMIIAYGLFGIFANIALLVNLLAIIALMSFFGFTLTLPGQGDEAPDVPPGNVIIRLKIAPHANFSRDKDDLVHRVNITLFEALLGFHYELQHVANTTLNITQDAVSQLGGFLTIEDEGTIPRPRALCHRAS
jgi:hypothetical protein